MIGPRTRNGPSRYAVTDGSERRIIDPYPAAAANERSRGVTGRDGTAARGGPRDARGRGREHGRVPERVWNFSAGPATLPLPVIEQAREELVALPGAGASILEISHRSAAFDAVLDEAEANLRDLLEIPPTHHVVFLQGGASLQFSMVPLNLLRGAGAGAAAAYVVTGSWGEKAVAEARREGAVDVVWDGRADGYRAVPELSALETCNVVLREP